MTAPTHRPTVPGSALSVAAGVLAVGLLLDSPTQHLALLVEIGGVVLLAAGYATWQRRSRVGGLLFAGAGALTVAAGFGIALTRTTAVTHRLELLPGMLGLVVLLAGLLPVRPGRERALVTAGTALLFVGVLTSGVVRGTTRLPLLLAGVATVLAWDLGEDAVSLGRQVGREARTHRAELTHAGGSLAAGAGIVVVALGVAALGVRGLSLTGLAALLVAGFALAAALRH